MWLPCQRVRVARPAQSPTLPGRLVSVTFRDITVALQPVLHYGLLPPVPSSRCWRPEWSPRRRAGARPPVGLDERWLPAIFEALRPTTKTTSSAWLSLPGCCSRMRRRRSSTPTFARGIQARTGTPAGARGRARSPRDGRTSSLPRTLRPLGSQRRRATATPQRALQRWRRFNPSSASPRTRSLAGRALPLLAYMHGRALLAVSRGSSPRSLSERRRAGPAGAHGSHPLFPDVEPLPRGPGQRDSRVRVTSRGLVAHGQVRTLHRVGPRIAASAPSARRDLHVEARLATVFIFADCQRGSLAAYIAGVSLLADAPHSPTPTRPMTKRQLTESGRRLNRLALSSSIWTRGLVDFSGYGLYACSASLAPQAARSGAEGAPRSARR